MPANFFDNSATFDEKISLLCLTTIDKLNFNDLIINLTYLKNLKLLELCNCIFDGDGCLSSPVNLRLNLIKSSGL